MPPRFESDSEDEQQTGRPFHRKKSVRKLLGGGKVADILLWKNMNLSAGVLAGATLLWCLFDVVEYTMVTLLCHITLIAVIVVFIWSNAAPLLDRAPPKIPEVVISERAFREFALAIHPKVAHFASVLYDIGCGKDLKDFLLVTGFLWVLSVIGSTCSFITLLYLGFLCAHTLPALYVRYETEVDHLIARGWQDLQKLYQKIDCNVLNKIPRGRQDKS